MIPTLDSCTEDALRDIKGFMEDRVPERRLDDREIGELRLKLKFWIAWGRISYREEVKLKTELAAKMLQELTARADRGDRPRINPEWAALEGKPHLVPACCLPEPYGPIDCPPKDKLADYSEHQP